MKETERWIVCFKKQQFLPLICACLLSSNIFADSISLSNEKILGAVPAMFDNIGIVRYADLDPDTIVGREFIRTSPVEQTVLDDTVPLINYIWQRLYIEGLAVGVTALSNRDISASMNYSNRSTVRIYVAEDTTHAVEQAVAERSNLQRIDHPDYAVYQDSSAPGLAVYAAFLGDNVVIIANTLPDIHTLAERLMAQDTLPAENWAGLSKVDKEAPVVILRYLKYPVATPPESGIPTEEKFIAAMWINDTSEPIFDLEISTNLQLNQAQEYFTKVAATELIAGPDGVALRLENEQENNSGNYTGEFEIIRNEQGDHYTDLIFVWLLGVWFAI